MSLSRRREQRDGCDYRTAEPQAATIARRPLYLGTHPITCALKRDVVAITGSVPGPGNAQMRKDKRIRPLVLRVNEGDCLQVNFQNWLSAEANPFPAAADRLPPMNAASPFLKIDDQVAGRFADFHVRGLQLADNIGSDASNVGKNASSLVAPGGSATYKYFAPPGTKGAYLADSYGATFDDEASAGNTGQGMFAAVNVEPKGARWYRSQVTEEELRLATTGTTAAGQPIFNYEGRYPNVEPWITEGKAGKPILNMRNGNSIFHSDLNAVIAGPNADGSFPASCITATRAIAWRSGTCMRGKNITYSICAKAHLRAESAYRRPGRPYDCR